MENSGELSVADFARLMKDYLDRRIGPAQYAKSYFALFKKRMVVPNEELSRILQQAYGDADDYEPDTAIRQENPKWVGETELKERVEKSLRELRAFGYVN